MAHLFSIIAGLNFSSKQSQIPAPDNRTIQNYVEDYLNEYVSGLNLSLAQGQPEPLDNRTIQIVVKAYLEEFVGRYT